MSGQILGNRYEVERQLGRTSGRWTLLARDLTDDVLVVVKLLFIDDDLQATDLKLFKREVDALKLLNHPTTSRYLDYFEIDMPRDGKALALVESYIEGTSLAAYVARQRLFNEVEANYIVRKALEILSHLHQNAPPIVHRDIRPSNLLLEPVEGSNQPKVHLVDFGSVRSLGTTSTALTMIGVNGYMPPEQASGRALAVSDLYSLGATLVHAMTGKSPAELQTDSFRINFESAIVLSPEFANWLKQMLSPSLEYRWSSAQAALEALPN
ncbi:MAG: serine/threonine-protein kinase [Cyanobacteria bacterium J06635_15]